jgi:hypothetical protein
MTPRLPRSARVAATAVHIVASLGWLALVVAVVAYPAMQINAALLVPTVAVSIGTGLVLALGTPYGLVRYWWILAKLATSVALAVAGSVALAGVLPRGAVLPGRIIALVVLFVLVCLSVAKPRARTPWGHPPTGRHAKGREIRTIEP